MQASSAGKKSLRTKGKGLTFLIAEVNGTCTRQGDIEAVRSTQKSRAVLTEDLGVYSKLWKRWVQLITSSMISCTNHAGRGCLDMTHR